MFKKNDYNSDKLTVIAIFSIIAAVFSAIGYFAGTSTVENTIYSALEDMEALKVGGAENRAKVKKLYTSPAFVKNQTDQIDAALQSLGVNAAPNANDNGDNTAPEKNPTDTINTLSQDQIDALLDNQPITGNSDSDIILLEYSDFECPFCQKEFEEQIVENLIQNNDISYTLKQFPLTSIHPQAQKAAEGALCVSNLAGPAAYFEYRSKVFGSKDPSLANITSIAKSLGINEANFTNCLDSGKEATEVASQTREGQTLFGINGTPGNVLINKKTGKYIVISGAQPLSSFTSALSDLQ